MLSKIFFTFKENCIIPVNIVYLKESILGRTSAKVNIRRKVILRAQHYSHLNKFIHSAKGGKYDYYNS